LAASTRRHPLGFTAASGIAELVRPIIEDDLERQEHLA
jgi:hypothetical protein